MDKFPRLMRRVFVATSFAAALSIAQASATEGGTAVGEPAAAFGAVEAPPAVVASPTAGTATVAASSDASSPVSPASATRTEPSASQAMASTAYPAGKRHRAATNRPAYRPVASGSYEVRGSDPWYRRHFVLMLGVAY